jgi:acyl carrier protein
MEKKQLSQILGELILDEDVENDIDRMVIIGSSSLLSLQFVTIIEETFNIEIDNDDLNYKFFSDIDYVENIVNKYISLRDCNL